MTETTRISGLALAAALALAGCEAPAPATPPQPQVTAAYFAEDPARITEAARAACDGPGERHVRPRPGVNQCRLLMDPALTAAVILSYDGAVEPLPELVISLSTARAGEGWLVTGCTFIAMAHKDGSTLRIVQNDRRIEARLAELLAAVGGKPVREVPPEAAERCFSL